jgi:hypothetical protein
LTQSLLEKIKSITYLLCIFIKITMILNYRTLNYNIYAQENKGNLYDIQDEKKDDSTCSYSDVKSYFLCV